MVEPVAGRMGSGGARNADEFGISGGVTGMAPPERSLREFMVDETANNSGDVAAEAPQGADHSLLESKPPISGSPAERVVRLAHGLGGAREAGADGLTAGGAGRAAGGAGRGPLVGIPLELAGDVNESGVGRVSITAFLTDGSIARMCDEMTRLTGVPIWLRDVDGRVIVPTDGSTGSLWTIINADAGAARAFSLVGRTIQGRLDLFVAPLKTTVGDIGSIVMPADWGRDDPAERRALERAVTIMAGSAAESCQGQVDLSKRVHELDALFRLSSLLVRATEPDAVLEAALELALSVLRADAGSISVLDDPGNPQGPLVHRVSRGLSEQWLSTATPISVDGELRSRALCGEIVQVPDLQSDPRIAEPQRARAEGLHGMIVAGLLYQGRAGGLIRLYSRVPRKFSDQQCELLRAIADHVAMVLAHARLRQLREQDQQLQRQMRLAADVQRRMLPRSIPSVDGLEIAARYAPSFQLGGDFYDLDVVSGLLGLTVGDVVGKGVPAALIMSAVRASLRAYSSSSSSIAELVSKVNKATVRDTLESEFVTLWVGTIDPETLVLTCCSAGHDPAMLLRPGGRNGMEVLELGVPGMVAGVDAEQTYEDAVYQLQTGDVLIAHTDGLSDAVNFDGQKFGRSRIRDTVCDLLAQEPAASAGRITEHLMWTLRQHCGVQMAIDDVTLVVVRVTGRAR